AEDEADRVAADEGLADQEGLGDAAGVRLDLVGQGQPDLAAVAEELLDARRVARRADDEDVTDAREHQHRQRIIDDRLVVDRQQLLADRTGERIEPAAAAAGEEYSL